MKRPELRDDLALMEGYHSPQVDVEVRLNTNESPEPPPLAWRDALAAELSTLDWHRYPDRAAVELREGLAAHYRVDPAMVFAANGSNEVLQSLLLAYGGPGRAAAVFEPTYALHSHISRVTGTDVVVGERAPDFSLDRSEVDRVLDLEPDIVFLCSPNNPTGMVEPQALIRHVVDRAAAIGSLVIVDEAYGQFARWSAVELVGEDAPVVVSRTFSKTWSMAAARLGYLVAPTWVVQAIESVVLPYHLDAAKQTAGRLALRYADDMRDRVDRLVAERTRIAAAFDDLPVQHWPSGANFILFRAEEMAGDRLWQALLDRSILVRNCASWPRLDGCLRVTVGTPEENSAFLTAMTEILT
ncbi:MAG: histidinol-phosphate transaminase [Actinomycetota bacterium]